MNRRMRSLHRSIGTVVALALVLLAVTGILLNHTIDLKLDQKYLTWDWLLEHHGLGQVEPDAVYLLDQYVVSQFDQQIFIETTPVIQSKQVILGGVLLDDLLVLATENSLLLFTLDGEFIERMDASVGVPSHIQNIGLFHGEPIIQTHKGLWRSDFMLDQWEKVLLQGVGWSSPQPLPDIMAEKLSEYFRGKGVSVEQFILEIHNGHIVAKYGVWLLDLLGLLIILLSLSGLWLWTRQTMAKRKRRRVSSVRHIL